MLAKFLSKNYLFIILFIIFLMDIFIIFDIPIFRSIVVFFVLTFIPGFLVIQSLNLDIEDIKKILLSIGTSLSFIMIYYAIVNYLSLQLGFTKPLSLIPVLISLNIALVGLVILANKFDESKKLLRSKLRFNIQFSNTEKSFLIFAVFLPPLGFLGVYLMNYMNINFVILLLYVLIALFVILITIFNHKATNRLYIASIFSISLSLVILLPLRSMHVSGADINLEYYYYVTTLKESLWAITGSTSLDACLSISFLPTIYQLLSNVKTELLFKFIFPIICSTIPICIYIISKKYVKNSYAFLAAFFSISQTIFINLGTNSRTFIAILFVALCAMVIFDDYIPDVKKMMLFILFLFSCILSHYTTSYITFMILLISFVGITLFSCKYKSKSFLTIGVLVLFFCLIYFWYAQVTQYAFDSGVQFFGNVLNNLNQMFVYEAQTSAIQDVSGASFSQESIPYKINFLLNWTVLFVLFVGFTSMIVKFKNFLGLKNKMDFLESKVDPLYFMIVCASFMILLIVFSVPVLTKGYDMSRPYFLTLVFMSVVFIFGTIMLTKIIKIGIKTILNLQISFEKLSYFIILLIMIPFFFSVTGTNYAISGDPQSMIISSSSDEYKKWYITDSESLSAEWLYANMIKRPIVTDHYGRYRLVSQGEINYNRILMFSNGTKSLNMYYYLRNNSIQDTSSYKGNINIIYNSGCVEVGYK